MNSENNLTGFPSIDKPWLKYFSEEELSTPVPEKTVYELIYENTVKWCFLNVNTFIIPLFSLFYKVYGVNLAKRITCLLNYVCIWYMCILHFYVII